LGKKKLKRDEIHLVHPYKDKKKDLVKSFQFITCLHETSYEKFHTNIDLMIDYLSKYINQPKLYHFTLAQTIKFYPSKKHYKEKDFLELPFIEFLYNYIMMAPLVDMGVHIMSEDIFNPGIATGAAIEAWFNSQLKKHRDKTSYTEMCQYFADILHNIDKICAYSGHKLGLSLDIGDFIKIMKRYDDAREIITVSNIPEDLSPKELEKESWRRIDRLSELMLKEKDLNSSSYIQNGLFNKGQFKEFASHITFKPDAEGNTIPITENTNLLMGIGSTNAQFVDGNGGRKAENLKLKVSDAGKFEYDISVLLSDISHVDTEYDCGSNHLRRKRITSVKDLQKISGRAYVEKESSRKFDIIDEDDHTLVGKTVYLKTPITCSHPFRHEGYICRGCIGELLAIVNQHAHLGKITAFDMTEAFQQKLLSAKHQNITDTEELQFSDNFKDYFFLDGAFVKFNKDLYATNTPEDLEVYQELYLEFNELTMTKNKDGEGRRRDRGVPEIIIFNARTGDSELITEDSAGDIYLSPSMVDYYLEAKRDKDKMDEDSDIIRIPFLYLLESLEEEDYLFESPYSNKELNEILQKAMKLIDTKRIEEYTSYNDLCDQMVILYDKSNISMDDIHIEILLSRLIHGINDESFLDWSEDEVEYQFRSITKSIRLKESALTSLMHGSAKQQLKDRKVYDKRAPGDYDAFIMNN